MANLFYPAAKQLALSLLCGVGTRPTGTLKSVIIDTNDVSYNPAHVYYSSVASGAVGTPGTIANPTFTNGLLDGDDVTLASVTGDQSEAVVNFLDTGNPATSPLINWIDTGVSGLPVTPVGGNVVIAWNASGIAQL